KNEKIACDVLGDWSRAAGLQGRANLLLTTAAQHEIGRGRVFPLTLKRWEVEARDGLEVVLRAELLALCGDATREGRAGPEDSAALTVAGAEKEDAVGGLWPAEEFAKSSKARDVGVIVEARRKADDGGEGVRGPHEFGD